MMQAKRHDHDLRTLLIFSNHNRIISAVHQRNICSIKHGDLRILCHGNMINVDAVHQRTLFLAANQEDFLAALINVTKLESRPLPDRDFEFMFYFDLETSIYSEEFVQLMCELENLCEDFKYLGSYCEVV